MFHGSTENQITLVSDTPNTLLFRTLALFAEGEHQRVN